MSTDDPDRKTTKVTRKGQVTIPAEFREELGLEEGDEVVWQSGEEGLVIRPAKRDAGRGMLFDEDVPEEKREEVVRELNDEIREKRRTDWDPRD